MMKESIYQEDITIASDVAYQESLKIDKAKTDRTKGRKTNQKT